MSLPLCLPHNIYQQQNVVILWFIKNVSTIILFGSQESFNHTVLCFWIFRHQFCYRNTACCLSAIYLPFYLPNSRCYKYPTHLYRCEILKSAVCVQKDTAALDKITPMCAYGSHNCCSRVFWLVLRPTAGHRYIQQSAEGGHDLQAVSYCQSRYLWLEAE